MHLNGQHGSVIFGVSSGPFKLNHCSLPRRRKSKVGVLHLGTPAKPSVVTTSATFDVLTPEPIVPAGEFEYEAPGQYLLLTNSTPIQLSLVASGSNQYVSTAQVSPTNASGELVLTSMYQPSVAVS